MKIYLDYAAATPLDRRVEAAMRPYLRDKFYNPSALYSPARQIRQAVEAARAQIAQIIGAKPAEIIFTAGATESINLAIRGVARANDGHIIISAIEHEAGLAAAKSTGKKVIICPVLPSGLIDLTTLAKLISDQVVLVSIGYANNEVGTIQSLAKIGQLIKSIQADRNRRRIKRPLLLHSDASQAPNYLDLHVSRLGVDLLTLNGGKIYGPKQTGCLYVRSGARLEPLVFGGGQERGLRSGTENVAGIIGFAKALKLAQKDRQRESKRLTNLRDRAIKDTTSKINRVHLNGDHRQRLPNNLNLTIDGVNGETLVHHLDHRDVLIATGAACSANKDTPSHVLRALGLSIKQVNSSLRITMGRHTTVQQINGFSRQLSYIVSELRSQG